MSKIIIVGGLLSLIVLLLIVGAPLRSMKWLGQFGAKLVISVILLFFINVFGASLGWHIPINIFTVVVGSIFGIFGIVSLLLLQILLF